MPKGLPFVASAFREIEHQAGSSQLAMPDALFHVHTTISCRAICISSFLISRTSDYPKIGGAAKVFPRSGNRVRRIGAGTLIRELQLHLLSSAGSGRPRVPGRSRRLVVPFVSPFNRLRRSECRYNSCGARSPAISHCIERLGRDHAVRGSPSSTFCSPYEGTIFDDGPHCSLMKRNASAS